MEDIVIRSTEKPAPTEGDWSASWDVLSNEIVGDRWGKDGSKGFIRYKETASSNFFIEQIIENYIGIAPVQIKFTEVIKLGKLFNNSIFKNAKTYETLSNGKESNAVASIEKVFASRQFVVRYLLNYGGTYGIMVYLPDNTLQKFFTKLFSKKSLYKTIEEKGNINILLKNEGRLYLSPIEKKTELIIDNYEDFEEIHNSIIKDLQKNKGIFLFHGPPGTGKTNYIKSLPNVCKGKKFIFIPPAFGEVLSTPDFLNFMIGHKGSILIIEDAESILKSRKGGQNHAVSNILNLTDGILSELLEIQIICTLNCNVSQIDEAIRRPGRLIREHNFDKLSIDKSNERLKKLHPDKKYESKCPMTLSEIYNFTGECLYESTIGFKR